MTTRMDLIEKIRRFEFFGMSINGRLGPNSQEALLLNVPHEKLESGIQKENEENKEKENEKSKDEDMTYREIIQHLQSTSTFHGVCHAGNALNQKSQHFWHISFLICFTLLTIQMCWLYQKYIQYEKTVDLDLKFENASFPAVTFCNLNPYKASAISQDPGTRNTMNAFMSRLAPETLPEPSKASKKAKKNDENPKRRYYQVYSKCFCESVKTPGGAGVANDRSCYPGYQGKVEVDLEGDTDSIRFKSSKCLCQFDYAAKSLWPCFPVGTWKERLCQECHPELGDCPMRVEEKPYDSNSTSPCLCNEGYNHCLAHNENGEVPEVFSAEDIQKLYFGSYEEMNETETIEATTETVEFRQAMGFEELTDEIAISTQAQQNLMFAVGEKELREKIALSHSKSDLILKCSFNQRDCDFERDFQLHHDPTYGNCYTFNWNKTKPVSVHRAGANYGLRILLFSNRSEYLPTSEAVGFRITIHDQQSYPFPDAFGYSAPTGFMSSFGVRMKQFHRIPPPYGQCLEGGENSDSYIYKGYDYSLEGCHRSCTQNEISRVCGCADPLYPLPNNNTQPCSVNDPKGRECIKRVTQYINLAINEGTLPNCSCHQPCSNIAYEVYYSAAGWPSGTTKIMECEPNDEICMEKYRKNAAFIQVFYEELNQETLSESPAYTWMSLIADVGGLTGLWVGASVVSLGEIVMVVFYTIKAYRKRPRRTYIASETGNHKNEWLDRLWFNLKLK